VYELACDEFLEVIGRQYVDEIVADDIIRFQKALAGRGMSPRTVSNRHSSVKASVRYCGCDTKVLPKPPKYDKDNGPRSITEQGTENALFRCRDLSERMSCFIGSYYKPEYENRKQCNLVVGRHSSLKRRF